MQQQLSGTLKVPDELAGCHTINYTNDHNNINDYIMEKKSSALNSINQLFENNIQQKSLNRMPQKKNKFKQSQQVNLKQGDSSPVNLSDNIPPQQHNMLQLDELVLQQELQKRGSSKSPRELFDRKMSNRLNSIQQNQIIAQIIAISHKKEDNPNDKKKILKSTTYIQEDNKYLSPYTIFYAQKSLGIFTQQNPIRNILVDFKHTNTFKWINRILLSINIIAYIIQDYRERIYEESTVLNDISYIIELICTILFTILMFISIISMGFALEKGTYLRKYWNWLDFISNIASILQYFKNAGEFTEFVKTIRFVRIFRMIELVPKLKKNFGALIRTLPKLGNNFFSLIAMMIFFSIIGLHLFRGATEYRCRQTQFPDSNGYWPVDENVQYLCSFWTCPDKSYCGSPQDYNLPFNQSEIDNDYFNYGFTQFDNFYWSMLSVFHLITLTQWSSINFIHWRYFNSLISASFFIFTIILCSYICLNLFLGTLYDEFTSNSEYTQEQLQQRKAKRKMSVKVKMKEIKNELIRFHSEMENQRNHHRKSTRKMMRQQKKEFQEKLKNKKFNIDEYLLFRIFSNLLIIIPIILYCSDYDGISQSTLYNYELADFFILNFITLEFLIRLIFYGLQNYFSQSLFNILDFLIISSNWTEIIVKQVMRYSLIADPNDWGPAIQLTKSLRLFRLLYDINVLQPLDKLLYAFFRTIQQIAYYMVIILIYLIAFCCIGCQLFAYKARFKDDSSIADKLEDGKSPILNFDNFQNSLLLMVLALLNENWQTPMYDYMRTFSQNTVWFFVIVILTGQILIVKLFLAMFINNYLEQIQTQHVFEKKKEQQNVDLLSQDSLSPIQIHNSVGVNSIQSSVQQQSQSQQLCASNINKNSEPVNNPEIINAQNDDSLKQQVKDVLDDVIMQIEEKINSEKNLIKLDIKMDNLQKSRSPFEKLNSLQKYQTGTQSDSVVPQDDKGDLVLINSNNNNPKVIAAQIPITGTVGEKAQQTSPTKFKKQVTLSFKVQSNFAAKKIQVLYKKQSIVAALHAKTGKFLRVREKAKKIVNSKKFQNSILILIALSSVLSALDTPLRDPNSQFSLFVRIVEFIVIIVFSIEALIKFVALGIFFNGENSYFRSGWNILDLFCLIFSILTYTLQSKISFIKALRSLRILKISILYKKVQIVMISLIQSIPLVFKLMILALAMLIIFGIYGLKYLKGKLYYCTNFPEEILIKNQQMCFDYGGDWLNDDFSWDNILTSTFNLFILETSDGWMYFMFKVWKVTGGEYSLNSYRNVNWTLFFVMHFFIGNFLVLNTFIGILIEKFRIVNKFYSPYKDLTPEQKEWVIIKQGIYQTKPQIKFNRPTTYIRGKFYDLIHQSKKFNLFMDIVIILNTLDFMLYYQRQSQTFNDILNYVNYGLVFLFMCEIFMKLVLYQKEFLKSLWSIMELILLITAITGIIWTELWQQSINEIPVLKVVIRALRLVKSFRPLAKMFQTLVFVIPDVAPIAVLLLLILYIFTLFGVQLFAYIRFQTIVNDYDLHFRSFSSGIFTLLRVVSQEQWYEVLGDLARVQQPNFVCIDIKTYEEWLEFGYMGCGTSFANYFFFFFHIIVSVIILNLFLAVLLSSSVDAIKMEKTAMNIYQLSDVQNLWLDFDPNGVGFINYKDFWRFSSRIAMIYGVKQQDLLDIYSKKQFLQVLRIPIYINKKENIYGYKFHHVIVQLTKISVFIKYKQLVQTNDEDDLTDPLIDKHLFEKTQFNSGTMATLIVLSQKFRKWIRKARQKLGIISSMSKIQEGDNQNISLQEQQQIAALKKIFKKIYVVQSPTLLQKKFLFSDQLQFINNNCDQLSENFISQSILEGEPYKLKIMNSLTEPINDDFI